MAGRTAECFGEGRALKFLHFGAPLRTSFYLISNTVFLKQDVVTPTRKFRIAERLVEARRSVAPALSQAGLAKRVQANGLKDCSGSRLSRLEAGYADADWREVEGLANALKVSPHWLAMIDELPSAAAPAIPAAQPLAEAPPSASADPTEPAPVYGAHSDLAALERGAHRSDYDFRQHLSAALGRARAKLHETGLPAADWKHWRMVERKAIDELRKSS